MTRKDKGELVSLGFRRERFAKMIDKNKPLSEMERRELRFLAWEVVKIKRKYLKRNIN